MHTDINVHLDLLLMLTCMLSCPLQADESKLDEELAACKRAGLTEVEMVDLQGASEHGGIQRALKFPRYLAP